MLRQKAAYARTGMQPPGQGKVPSPPFSPLKESCICAARMRRLLPFICLFAALFAGCDSALQRADLVVINGAEPDSLDPAKIRGQPEGRVTYALFEGLTRFRSDGEVEPGMAEK